MAGETVPDMVQPFARQVKDASMQIITKSASCLPLYTFSRPVSSQGHDLTEFDIDICPYIPSNKTALSTMAEFETFSVNREAGPPMEQLNRASTWTSASALFFP